RYNLRHGAGVPWVEWRQLMFRQLDVLSAIGDGRRVGLVPEEHAFFTGRAQEMRAGIESAGYDVVGDLAELVPGPEPAAATGEDPTELSDTELLAAALDVVHLMLTANADENRAARKSARRRLRRRRSDPADG